MKTITTICIILMNVWTPPPRNSTNKGRGGWEERQSEVLTLTAALYSRGACNSTQLRSVPLDCAIMSKLQQTHTLYFLIIYYNIW